MSYFKRRVLPFAAGLAFAVSATVPSAATVVNVELWRGHGDGEGSRLWRARSRYVESYNGHEISGMWAEFDVTK